MRAAGIGVSRNAVPSKFEASGYDFRFDPPNVGRDGEPRVVGYSQSRGIGIIELTGPARELSAAHITVGLPEYDDGAQQVNTLYLVSFALAVVPTWDDSVNWLNDNFRVAVEQGAAATTRIAAPAHHAALGGTNTGIIAHRQPNTQPLSLGIVSQEVFST